jgi:UDP-2,4-diacetamido-2,4,6-trideoxy-beta-L-altropyranose hydrolase
LTPIVFFRADGNASIGLGHLVRCMALADMLKGYFSIIFVTFTTDSKIVAMLNQVANEVDVLTDSRSDNFLKRINANDIVVLDGYQFTENDQKNIKDKGAKLVFIDDLNQGVFFADVIINMALGAALLSYQAQTNCRFLLGPDYALLRKPFLEEAKKQREIAPLSSLFINMGGSDEHNVTLKVLKAAQTVSSLQKIHVVTGAAYPHYEQLREWAIQDDFRIELYSNLQASEMRDLLVSCQAIICPASGVVLEATSVGLAILSGHTAANQLEALKGLEAAQVLINMGDLIQLKEEQIKTYIEDLVIHTDTVCALIASQKQLIDGLSNERILKVFQELQK